MRLSILSRKGGVGKTTTAVNLAAGLADEGLRTCLVDLDSQGNVGLSFGWRLDALAPSMTDVLMDGEPIESAVRETPVPNLHVVTCDERFANAAARIGQLPAAERTTLLRDALEPIRAAYDVVLYDNAAAVDLVAVNALVASDAYLIVMQPEKFSLDGLQSFRRAVKSLEAQHGLTADLLGIAVTMADDRLVVVREVIEVLRANCGPEVLTTEIPRNTRVHEAQFAGKPVYQYSPTSTGAEAYRALTREVVQRATQRGLLRRGGDGAARRAAAAPTVAPVGVPAGVLE
jgi:chromosome partitioning protein